MIGMACVLMAALLSCTPSRKDLGNVLRVALVTNIKGFDPAHASDLYSFTAQLQVYEPLYQYKYLARPYDVEPCLADSLPAMDSSGTEYLIRIRPGIYFTDDVCFLGGKGREVRAEDFVYSIKRMADLRTKTTGWWIFDGKVAGLDSFRSESAKLPPGLARSGDPLYLREVEGLQALDDYTVRIKLTKPYPYFKYILTMPYTAVVAQEAVDYYGEEFLNHPVGTGPFVLREWRRGLRLVYERNPAYKHGTYPTEGEPTDSVQGLLRDAGRQVPFLDRLELYIYEESQPRWLNFLRSNLDRTTIPKDNYQEVMTAEKTLKPEIAAKGIRLTRAKDLDLTYITINMEDPILGKNRKLRQAMSLAHDVEELIELFYNGRAVRAHSPVPPGLFGYDSTFRNPFARFDLDAAKRTLAEAGFPAGKGLPEFEYTTTSSTTNRQMAEHFAQNMARIGVRIKISGYTWPEFLDRLKKKKIQIAGAAWGADYPDPENFLQLLYGPNEAPGENSANYKNAEYDALYREIAVMQDTEQRRKKIVRMQEIVAEDCPWIFNTHRLSENLTYAWLSNDKPHAVVDGQFKYIRVNADLRARMTGNAKKTEGK